MSAALRGLVRSSKIVSQTYTQKATMVFGPPRVKISFTVSKFSLVYHIDIEHVLVFNILYSIACIFN